MPNKPVSRRSFMAAASSVPAVAANRQAVVVPPVLLSPPKPAQDTLLIVTMYKFEPAEIAKIKAAAPKAEVNLVVCNSREEFHEKVKDAEVVYGDVRADTLQVAEEAEMGAIRRGRYGKHGSGDAPESGGADQLPAHFCAWHFGNRDGHAAVPDARHRQVLHAAVLQAAQMQPVGTVKSADHTELVGRTMGIVGMGGIGSAMARRAHYGFDMRIVATDAKPMSKPEYVAELHDPGWFMTMVPQVDVLVGAAPHTPQTERMFNEQVFRSMKKSAYFLAMSRGKLYDDMALVKALKEGWIAGAGLDVFPMEPPPSDHPIFDCPNVVMTAHTSGWSPDRQVRVIDLFAENVRRYTEGLPLMNVVDKQRGY